MNYLSLNWPRYRVTLVLSNKGREKDQDGEGEPTRLPQLNEHTP